MIIRMVTLKKFFLAMLGLHCCAWAFSTCSEWGLLSSGDAQASHCIGFSLGVFGCMGSVVVANGLTCLMACGILVPGPRIESVSPALAGGFLITGLAREVPDGYI